MYLLLELKEQRNILSYIYDIKSEVTKVRPEGHLWTSEPFFPAINHSSKIALKCFAGSGS